MDKIHPIFKTLTFDAQLNWYECRMPLGNKEIEIFISLDDIEDEETIIAQAIDFYMKMDKWCADAELVIVRDLLEEINSGWLPDNHNLLTEHDLLKVLTFESATILAHNCFELLFKCGNMLAGHSILVSGSTVRGVVSADIVG